MDNADYIFLDGLNFIADAKIALENIQTVIVDMRSIITRFKIESVNNITNPNATTDQDNYRQHTHSDQ